MHSQLLVTRLLLLLLLLAAAGPRLPEAQHRHLRHQGGHHCNTLHSTAVHCNRQTQTHGCFPVLQCSTAVLGGLTLLLLYCRILHCALYCCTQSTIGTSDNPPYAEARKIYLDGKNSYKNDGTIRTLRGEPASVRRYFCSKTTPCRAMHSLGKPPCTFFKP